MGKIPIIVIVLMLVSVGFLSGCNGITTETSISYIREHANKYINKTVTVKAIYYGNGNTSRYMIIDSSQNSMDVTESNNVVKPTPLVRGSEYKFTGIVRYSSAGLYLEVTKIEAT
jgi:uncharacterized protein (DUF58 family)